MKQYLTILTLVLFTASAFARPQLHTSSIGWINPADIFCEQTSDHICTVTKKPFAYTFVGQHKDIKRYKVPAGTELVVGNEGRKNEPVSQDETNEWIYSRRVEVAIVIPADWGKDGKLRPDKPCHLSYQGSFPKIVKLACKK